MKTDTIVAPATGQGGAIAVLRVSGPEALAIVERIFVPRNGQPLAGAKGHTVHLGEIIEPSKNGVANKQANEVVDEVLATVFRAPHSYTGEDSVEISCHASPYIIGKILQLLLSAGARMATAGEFTTRAFLAGKLDLAQAEAVADLICSSDRAGHRLAMEQMRGGVSSALGTLRDELVRLAALLELELDFGEEDVEFASREGLKQLADKISDEIKRLVGSFSLGNAIKEGIVVAIVGRPNAGKSTLLNALVGEERAMVSDIAGTTRDRIEERVVIGGVGFRFIDTAGLRQTDDALEQMGIERALDAASRARVVLLVVSAEDFREPSDLREPSAEKQLAEQIAELDLSPDQKLYVVINKIDVVRSPLSIFNFQFSTLEISAKTGAGLDTLRDYLTEVVDVSELGAGSVVVSNARHFEALTRADEALERISKGISECIPTDLLAEDIRETLHHLGAITGEVTSDDILGTIFSKFCIGK